jgi:CelD/BcsL family acetyltransferase involved in cellulose biosynthesis
MECRILEEISEFKALADKWDEALVSSREDSPFLLSDFIITWWRHHARGRKLRIFLAQQGGVIVAGMPLCLERRFLRNNLAHVGGCWANLTHFFSTDKELNVIALLLECLRRYDDWGCFVLERVLPAHALVQRLKNNGWKNLKDFGCLIEGGGLQGLIDLGPGYPAIIAGLNPRLKRYLRSGKELAAKIGELKLIKIEGKDGLNRLFRDFRHFSIAAFRLRNNVSMFENSRESAFFADLIENFALQDRIDAYRFNAGDTTLGISFGYRFGRGFKWILTTYNPAFHNLRPGHLMLEALVQEAIKRGEPYFDMYYGGELFYKQQWCNRMIPLQKITVFRKGPLNQACLALKRQLISCGFILAAAKAMQRQFIRIKNLKT